MIIYEMEFDFEVDREQGSMSIYYPTAAAAKKDAREILAEKADDLLARMDEPPSPKDDLPREVLTARLNRVTTTDITRASFCTIINTRGGSFVVARAQIATLSLRVGNKRINIVNTGEGQ